MPETCVLASLQIHQKVSQLASEESYEQDSSSSVQIEDLDGLIPIISSRLFSYRSCSRYSIIFIFFKIQYLIIYLHWIFRLLQWRIGSYIFYFSSFLLLISAIFFGFYCFFVLVLLVLSILSFLVSCTHLIQKSLIPKVSSKNNKKATIKFQQTKKVEERHFERVEMKIQQKYNQQQMSINKSNSKNTIALDLSTHNLNNSSSKQRFSFPKATRFDSSKFLCDSFYQMPSTRSGRATSFGYGHKDMGIRDHRYAPQPASYKIQSQFDQRKKGISFAVGRQETAIGGPLGDSIARKYIPGPGNYKAYSTLEQTHTVTLKSRLPDRSQDHLRKNPGPGAYGYEQLGSQRYYVTSKHPNMTGTAKMTQKSERRGLMNKTIDIGPGQYNPTQSDLKPHGRYVLSNDKGSQSKVFSKSPRQSIVYKHLLATPGPGSYTPFTYFGPA